MSGWDFLPHLIFSKELLMLTKEGVEIILELSSLKQRQAIFSSFLLYVTHITFQYSTSKLYTMKKKNSKLYRKKSLLWVFKFTFDRWDHSLRGQSSHFPLFSNEFHKWALNKWMCCCPLPKKFFFTFCNKRCLAALIIICSTFFFWILLSYDVGTFSVSLFSNSHFFRKLFCLYLPNICDGCLSNP